MMMSQAMPELEDTEKLLWGPVLIKEVFDRWAQGFEFSVDEPTALVQHRGGPCAVLAPVQASILQCIICRENKPNRDWRQVSATQCQELLVMALMNILKQVQDNGLEEPPRAFVLCALKENEMKQTEEKPPLEEKTAPEYMQRFYTRLTIQYINSLEVLAKELTKAVPALQGPFGVLLFLYSVILSKGPANVRSEMSDPDESLVDSTHGHGNQSLINLVLTGSAVSHVWNNEKFVEGLRLRGISHQSPIGFLTLLEHLRYCQVGTFLKRPQYPIWVLGSETHLTVLFSFNEELVRPESPSEVAHRIFMTFDPEGNSFIPTALLQDLMRDLDLVCDEDYVDVMTKKLDNEGLGIILLKDFLNEFFPESAISNEPDTFGVWHHNALKTSNPENKVHYHEGQAVLLETDVLSIADNNPMQTCLQTKWPSIEITWERHIPSLN